MDNLTRRALLKTTAGLAAGLTAASIFPSSLSAAVHTLRRGRVAPRIKFGVVGLVLGALLDGRDVGLVAFLVEHFDFAAGDGDVDHADLDVGGGVGDEGAAEVIDGAEAGALAAQRRDGVVPVFGLAVHVVEIDGGEITVYSGNYDYYDRERAIRETNQQAAFARQQAMLAKEQRFIDRFRTHAAKAAQVQSRIKALDKIEKLELPKKRSVVKFEFRMPPRSGDQVAVMEGLGKRYGSRAIYDDFSMIIRRGERWAVMGRNGTGKTTLLRMVAGALKPDAGEVRLGASLKMGYFAQQSLDVLNPDLTVAEQLQQDFPHDSIGSIRSLAGAFQFSGDDVDKKIRSLSGGEKSRLAMARMLYDPPNFLVLDEPTNHLDMATKEMLVEALKNFEGTMLFVSHDRTFLRGLASRVLELGGDSGGSAPLLYPGPYEEYVASLGHEAPGIHT